MLPPYSSDFELIKMKFSKPKEGLRSLSERTVPGLMSAIDTVLRSVTAKEIRGWIQNYGYDYKQN
jgi:hypothetical protein